MEYNDIKKLMDDMGKSNIDELNIEFPEGYKISLKKNQTNNIVMNTKTVDNNLIASMSNTVQNVNEKQTKISEVKEETIDANIVKSPMVGTFYIKPSPTAEAFVEKGSSVKKGDTLCIIEAMKLMNEIESEYTGKILEILVKDGDVVEYGTPLFKIEI